VVWNETSIGHKPSRTVLHPLHVIMTVPIGLPLNALLGLREFSAVLISAIFAAGAVYLFDRLLSGGTSLGALERLLFVLLLGFSAGHALFGAIPETHVISTFFMTLLAWQFVSRGNAPIAEFPKQLSDWGRLLPKLGLIPAVLATGALVTNLLLAPVHALLAFSPALPRLRRLAAAAALSGVAVVLVGGLYLAQKTLLFRAGPSTAEGPRTASAAGPAAAAPAVSVPEPRPDVAPSAAEPPAPKPGGAKGWFGERFERELRYMALSPKRVAEVALALLFFNLYTPRVVTYLLPPNPEGFAVSKLTAVRLDYFAFDLRPSAMLGAAAWASVLISTLLGLKKAGNLRALFSPLWLFVASWLALYLVVFSLYHAYPIGPESNDIFLFAPNLVLPLLFLIAAAYAHGMAAMAPGFRRTSRALLAVAVLSVAVNTGLHTFDLVSHYAAMPAPS
jgi:hypothetical protein